VKRKINPIQAIKANARNLLALCCLGLLVSASLLLPEALIRWQNGRILGVFQPQPQQQAQLSNSRLSFQEKLSLLSGGVFYNGIQAYFSDPLPYWRDLDYNYLAIESDYRVAVSMAADITISPLLTGNRYDPESALSQCWNQLDRLTELNLVSPIQREEPWDVSIQPLLYLSRSAPSRSLIAWQIRLRQGDRQLWVSLDDESGLIFYLQQVYSADSFLLAEENPMALWAQYWGLEMQDCRSIHFGGEISQSSQYTAVYVENDEPFLFSAQFASTFCTFGSLIADIDSAHPSTRPDSSGSKDYSIVIEG